MIRRSASMVSDFRRTTRTNCDIIRLGGIPEQQRLLLPLHQHAQVQDNTETNAHLDSGDKRTKNELEEYAKQYTDLRR